jgi:hypothetical protein
MAHNNVELPDDLVAQTQDADTVNSTSGHLAIAGGIRPIGCLNLACSTTVIRDRQQMVIKRQREP